MKPLTRRALEALAAAGFGARALKRVFAEIRALPDAELLAPPAQDAVADPLLAAVETLLAPLPGSPREKAARLAQRFAELTGRPAPARPASLKAALRALRRHAPDEDIHDAAFSLRAQP